MKLSERGRAMLIGFEGRRGRVYRDVAGYLSGGIGHLLTARDQRAFPEGKQIPPDLIDVWFREDIETAEAILDSALPADSLWMASHWDALVSLAFNIPAAFKKTTGLFKALRSQSPAVIAAQIRRWCYATVNGKKVKVPGLVARREAEARLFETGVYPGQAARPVLRRGSSGPEVRRLQEMLNRLCWWLDPLKTDGEFGPMTEGMLGSFAALWVNVGEDWKSTTAEMWKALDAALERLDAATREGKP